MRATKKIMIIFVCLRFLIYSDILAQEQLFLQVCFQLFDNFFVLCVFVAIFPLFPLAQPILHTNILLFLLLMASGVLNCRKVIENAMWFRYDRI